MQQMLRGHYPTVRKHVQIVFDVLSRGSVAVFPTPPRVRDAISDRLGRFLCACARDHMLLVLASSRNSSPAVVRSANVPNRAATVTNARG